jgi:hypothetical protein
MTSAIYSTLRDAILQKLQVTADYHGFRREFCPHVIGMKHGREHMLGYQFAGGSKSGLPPRGEWRCFEVAELLNASTHTGAWHTGSSHTRPQKCVDQIDVEVDY